MARLVGADSLTNVAELGAGTGPITRALLELMPPNGRLWSFEIDADLAAGLRARFRDQRLSVVQESPDPAAPCRPRCSNPSKSGSPDQQG